MRSQKQVRRIGKVRSMKNAAAGKWKTYRKRQEARKAWQNNTVLTGGQHARNIMVSPPTTCRRIKEPKQRSPEQLAERKRLREQRRMEKKLAKQRASTSTHLKTMQKEKAKSLYISSPKKASAEPINAAKTTKVKNSTIEETAKAKRLMNQQAQRTVNEAKQEIPAKKANAQKATKVSNLQNEAKPKQQYAKVEKPILIDEQKEQKINHLSSPVQIEQNELMQSAKQTVHVNKTGKKASEEKVEEIVKEEKDGEMQLLDSAVLTGSKKSVTQKEIKQDHSTDSNVIGNDKVSTTRDVSKEKTLVKKKESMQVGQKTKKTEVHGSIEEVEKTSKEREKEKRNERSDPDNLFSQHDFVEVNTHEVDYEDGKADFTEIVERREINKGKGYDEKQSKPMAINGKGRNANDITETMNAVKPNDQNITSCAKETKYGANVEKKNPGFLLPQITEVNHIPSIGERVYKLLPRDIEFCVHMMERHGENYEAMAKDQGNVFGDSAKGIARKIRVFKESPEYQSYLKQKAERNGQVA